MGSLTETAQVTRKVIKFGGIGLIVLILVRGIWQLGQEWYRLRNPAPPAPPTVAFGKLPAIKFPQQTPLELTYKLQTVSGTTPDLGDRNAVYFMPYLRPNLLALERANKQVSKLDFESEPIMLDAKHYRWEKKDIKTYLTMNIITGEIEMEYDWRSDPEILLAPNLPGQEQAISEAKNFLQQAEILTEDLQLGQAKVSYWKIVDKELVKAVSLSEAHFVRVDFFRKNTSEVPIVTPSAEEGMVYLLFSGSKERHKRVVKLSYHYFPVDYENLATYPLKKSSQAYRELQTREAFVATKGNNQQIITIRKISLAYFDSAEPQQYLQPVYIFEGDNGFVAYVSAIDDQWVEK
ncbi:hypothetical protein KKD62_00225 [Patescibacteria group bacterium]|nr:hypothetical protein [Patescibacteria group bacterium]MBU1931184.1 hypothetical protein [Patescibacteria group bacterium]